MISGTAYGALLNDRPQLERLAGAFAAPPYKQPPRAPVLYIKPRTCFRFDGAPVPVPAEIPEVEIAATVALLFGRDLSAGGSAPLEAVGAACLALDVCEPHESFYRPAIRERCRDGFLPLGAFAPLPALEAEIVTRVDGREVHRWSLDRLQRPVARLLTEVAGFMTFRAGDLLLVGLPGDAPRAAVGRTVEVGFDGLPSLVTRLVAADAP